MGQLLDLYRNYLTMLARIQISPTLQSKLSASDLVQETFLRAKQGIRGFHGDTETELIAWLRRIMANRLADAFRSFTAKQRDVRIEQTLADRLDESSRQLQRLLPSHDPSPSEQFMLHEQVVQLADALEQLPDNYRQVIILRHLEGLSFPRVAVEMGRSLDSVKNLALQRN